MGIPVTVDADIERAVRVYPDGLLGDLAQRSDPLGGGSPLAIKYIPAKFADTYRGSGGRLRISTSRASRGVMGRTLLRLRTRSHRLSSAG